MNISLAAQNNHFPFLTINYNYILIIYEKPHAAQHTHKANDEKRRVEKKTICETIEKLRMSGNWTETALPCDTRCSRKKCKSPCNLNDFEIQKFMNRPERTNIKERKGKERRW